MISYSIFGDELDLYMLFVFGFYTYVHDLRS